MSYHNRQSAHEQRQYNSTNITTWASAPEDMPKALDEWTMRIHEGTFTYLNDFKHVMWLAQDFNAAWDFHLEHYEGKGLLTLGLINLCHELETYNFEDQTTALSDIDYNAVKAGLEEFRVLHREMAWRADLRGLIARRLRLDTSTMTEWQWYFDGELKVCDMEGAQKWMYLSVVTLIEGWMAMTDEERRQVQRECEEDDEDFDLADFVKNDITIWRMKAAIQYSSEEMRQVWCIDSLFDRFKVAHTEWREWRKSFEGRLVSDMDESKIPRSQRSEAELDSE